MKFFAELRIAQNKLQNNDLRYQLCYWFKRVYFIAV